MVFSLGTKKDIAVLLFALLLCSSVSAQIAVGEWRTHLPYQSANIVMVTDTRVFCSSTGGLFTYGLSDNSLETLSKTDGLSDNGVVAMNWSEENQLAVLAYGNANLDMMRNNRFINIPDILKKQIPGDKTVYNIAFIGGKAYLSCGFGIVVLDLNRLEISETYVIGDNGDQLKVNQVVSDGTNIYAVTDEGIRTAEIANPFLIDFNSWELMENLPDPLGIYSAAAFFNSRLYIIYHDPSGNDRVFYLENEAWYEMEQLAGIKYNELRSSGDYLVFTGNEGVRIMSRDFIVVRQYEKGNSRSATVDDDGVLWIADNGRGLVKVGAEDQSSSIKPNGPYSSIAYDMKSSGEKLYSVLGGVTSNWNNLFKDGVLQTFNDNLWTYKYNTDFQDLIALAVDPEDPERLYAASWGYGLIEYHEGLPPTVYNETNSTLESILPGGKYIRVGGLAFDRDNNLWMNNTGVAEPISVLQRDGTWLSFRADGILSDYNALGDLLITSEGHLWGILPKGRGLFALNFNGTLENEEDDQYELVSVVDKNGRVITNDIYSFAEDLDGNLWLGTNQGILVMYSPGRLFTDGSVIAQEILVRRDDGTDYADPLLETQKITDIEVDGSNRKWIGTAAGGAFLVSENGQEQVHHFNTSNSPILSNSITDICVNGKTGEVFFGTEKGIISFRGGATEGASNYANVKVFPNPVRETYDGPIAISGLVAETTVKITDIGGNLVNEIRSFGGQAIWDGTDFNGNRVATGVYLVFLANREATAAHVTKILFIH
jgi:hypothetical protein